MSGSGATMAGARGGKRGKAKAGATGVDAGQGEGRGQRQGGELRLKRGEAAAKAEPGTRRGAMIFFRGAVRCGLGQGREQGAAGRGPVLHGGVLGEGMEELTWGRLFVEDAVVVTEKCRSFVGDPQNGTKESLVGIPPKQIKGRSV